MQHSATVATQFREFKTPLIGCAIAPSIIVPISKILLKTSQTINYEQLTMNHDPNQKPQIAVILAMSADGKIADASRSAARFGSPADRAHLEQQIARSDAVLFGAGSLRAYETTLPLSNPELIQQRQLAGKSPQPVQIVVSRWAKFDPEWPFFRQPVPRWLLTTLAGAEYWQGKGEFEQILALEHPETKSSNPEIDWPAALQHLATAGLYRLAVLGGGELVASLLAAKLVDEIWFTICPLLLGGTIAPSPVGGTGFPEKLAPGLELLSVKTIGSEVFLHYRLQCS